MLTEEVARDFIREERKQKREEEEQEAKRKNVSGRLLLSRMGKSFPELIQERRLKKRGILLM